MLKNVKYLLTTHDMELMPKDNISEYVVVGKSNVGKSTFINIVTNQKKLAYTSSKPGKTRAITFFDVDNGKFRLVDIPGYGYAKISLEQKILLSKVINEFLSKRNNIFKIILLIDCRRGISDDDKEMINFFIDLKLFFTIIGTKLDKVNQSEQTKFIRNIQKELNITPIMYSALTKKGVEKIFSIFEN